MEPAQPSEVIRSSKLPPRYITYSDVSQIRGRMGFAIAVCQGWGNLFHQSAGQLIQEQHVLRSELLAMALALEQCPIGVDVISHTDLSGIYDLLSGVHPQVKAIPVREALLEIRRVIEARELDVIFRYVVRGERHPLYHQCHVEARKQARLHWPQYPQPKQ